jgi:hypothetical protein
MRKCHVKYFDSQTKQYAEADGVFHQWGSESVEDRDGNMVDTVAIVEILNGVVVTAIPRNIKFIDGLKEASK